MQLLAQPTLQIERTESWPLTVLSLCIPRFMDLRQTNEWPCSLTSRIEISGLSAHLMNSQAAFYILAFLGMPSPWLLAAGKCRAPGTAGIRTTARGGVLHLAFVREQDRRDPRAGTNEDVGAAGEQRLPRLVLGTQHALRRVVLQEVRIEFDRRHCLARVQRRHDVGGRIAKNVAAKAPDVRGGAPVMKLEADEAIDAVGGPFLRTCWQRSLEYSAPSLPSGPYATGPSPWRRLPMNSHRWRPWRRGNTVSTESFGFHSVGVRLAFAGGMRLASSPAATQRAASMMKVTLTN